MYSSIWMVALVETAKALLEKYAASLGSMPHSRGHNTDLS